MAIPNFNIPPLPAEVLDPSAWGEEQLVAVTARHRAERNEEPDDRISSFFLLAIARSIGQARQFRHAIPFVTRIQSRVEREAALSMLFEQARTLERFEDARLVARALNNPIAERIWVARLPAPAPAQILVL